MRELYIVFSIIICCGKQCLCLFVIPVILNILCATMFMWLSRLLFIEIPNKLKLFTYSIKDY